MKKYNKLYTAEFENFDKDTIVGIAQSKNMTSVLKEYSKADKIIILSKKIINYCKR